MRWDDLFADLERQWDALAAGERVAEIADRTRAEFAQVSLVDRLRGSEGRPVRIVSRCGQIVSGDLSRVGADFVLLTLPRHECVMPVAAIGSVAGLGAEAVSAEVVGPVSSRLGLGSVLRRIAADRSSVTVLGPDGQSRSGTLQRVGSDFLELAEHPLDEGLRPEHLRRPTLVPFAAVVLLRRETPPGPR